jgi:hypothetical protein
MEEAVIAPREDAPRAGAAGDAVLVDVELAGARVTVPHPALVHVVVGSVQLLARESTIQVPPGVRTTSEMPSAPV